MTRATERRHSRRSVAVVRPGCTVAATLLERPLRAKAFLKDDTGDCDPTATARRAPRPRNYSWAELVQRVFAIDVLECPSCGGRMRNLAAIHGLASIRAILECVGPPARPPPVSRPDPDDPEATDLFEAYPL